MSFPWAQQYTPKNPVMQWVDERLPLPRLVYDAIGAGYPVPRNLNYWWNFGVLSGVALVIQIITGIILAMHYYASVEGAFNSVEHIMRNVHAGWFMRYAHMNGASFFFIVVYIHMFRGLYFGSYKAPREMIWLLGRGHIPADDGDRFHGLRAALGADELLGSAGDYRLLLRDTGSG